MGDFNGDGRDDVYAITHTGSTNYLMFNTNSDPQAESTKSVTISENYYGAEAFDFDGDGNLDLLLGGGPNASDEAVILYGNGSNNFDFTRTQILTSSGDDAFGSVIQNDFNDDGKLDHLVSFNDYTAILFGDGAGNNVKTSTYNALTGNDGTDLLMGDFDGDGKDEIIGVDGNRYPVLYSYDSSTNQFIAEKTGTSIWAGYRDMMALDYDGDGDLDVVHNNTASSSSLKVFYNDGAGNFSSGNSTGLGRYENEPYTDMLVKGDLDGNGEDEIIVFDQNNREFDIMTGEQKKIEPTNGLGYFDSPTDSMRIYINNAKAGDTIEITQNSNNVVNGGGTYVIDANDITNGYADVELDFTNVADGTGIAFDITLTDTNVGRAPVTTTANIDVLPSATPIMAPTQPVYDAGDPLPVNDTVTNQPVGDANGDGVIDAADNHEFTIWFKENASDPSAIEEDDIITFTNLVTGEQSAADYVVTSADVQNGYANVLAEFTAGIPASTNLSDLQIQIEDHNTGNIVVFYGDHNQGNMYVHQAGSIATKHFILDVDGDTDVIASGEFNVHTDSLDLGSLLNGFVRNTGNGDLWDDLEAQGFVRKTDNGSDTTIEVDADGGGNNYVDAAKINGVTSTELDDNYLFYDED